MKAPTPTIRGRRAGPKPPVGFRKWGTLAKASGRSAVSASWLKAHAAGEKRLRRVLTPLFNRIGKEAAAAVRSDPSGTAAALGKRAFDPVAWTVDLKAAVKPVLAGLMRYGASRELQLAKPRPKAEVDLLVRRPSILSKETRVPPEVKDAIDEFLDGLMDRPYWDDILDNTKESLVAALKEGIDKGESGDQLAERVEEVLGPEASKSRASNIAATEATGAMNQGAEAARQPLYDAGLLSGKEWLGILDAYIRDDHEEANGQIVKPGDKFVVGGEECDFPGDPDLSAEQRCRCRCCTISISADESDDEEQADEDAEKALRWYKEWAE